MALVFFLALLRKQKDRMSRTSTKAAIGTTMAIIVAVELLSFPA